MTAVVCVSVSAGFVSSSISLIVSIYTVIKQQEEKKQTSKEKGVGVFGGNHQNDAQQNRTS